MGHIRAYYERVTELSESDWQYIAALFEYVKFSKGETITEQGNIEHFLYFIEQGIIRYYICDETVETTFDFCFEKAFASAYNSLITQTPSEYRLGALSNTVAWRISYENLQKMYDNTRIGNAVGRFLSEKLYITKSSRELALLRFTAKERYCRLLSERPEIIKHIPLKYIASYIGITPQALSRIRREIC
jgi:cAMP-binding proteins - catabolite gene activator and regulatory subunit of cAMP-dependent protein kinases